MRYKGLHHMNSEHLSLLSNVLWVQLSAVQQHFMHVLMLEVWGMPSLASKIADVDAIDLPNTLRIVDAIVQEGLLPVSDVVVISNEAGMPALGATLNEVLHVELSLDQSLESVLKDAAGEIAETSTPVSSLIQTPLNVRADYQSWLRRNIEIHNAELDDCGTDKHPTIPGISNLFEVLSLLINQTIIHSFVHWHVGDRVLADRTWFASGIAMMQTAKLTKRLAALNMTAGPIPRREAGTTPCISLASSSGVAVVNDMRIMRACRDRAEVCRADVVDERLRFICEETMGYFGQIKTDMGNVFETDIQNPCIGFDRIYETYVNGLGTAKKSA